jgi:N-acetylglucosaminyldiphosphoundecaprenol N-acetyl-beta-D-mannosaminyltransferase
MLDVEFDRVTLDETIERIDEMVLSPDPHYVVTPNVDFLVQARRDAHLKQILLDSHLVLCDGTPLVWASHWLGKPLPERVAGSDLAPRIVKLAAERNYRLFFLGASPDANTQAVANMRVKYPGLEISHYSPPFMPLAEMDHEEIGRRIRTARPHILFVAFGCPKGEKWMAMHYRSLGVPVMISVGATIDFLAGRVKRAPIWMRRSGVEWIFRMSQEPRRLFWRYASDLYPFARGITAQWWRERRA